MATTPTQPELDDEVEEVEEEDIMAEEEVQKEQKEETTGDEEEVVDHLKLFHQAPTPCVRASSAPSVYGVVLLAVYELRGSLQCNKDSQA